MIGLGAVSLARGRPRRSLASLRAAAAPVALAIAVLILVMLPQIPRLVRFLSTAAKTNFTGIAKIDIGNLVGPLSPWQALGVWDRADFRMPLVDPFSNGVWTAALFALVVLGALWGLRQGEWIVPAAAVASLAIWAFSDSTQSPYVAAKALVIASPLLMLVAARPLAEFGIRRPDQSPWVGMAVVAIMVIVVAKVGGSSFKALQYANVGPIAHLHELRAIKPLLEGRPTLFLGNDDFIRWELSGTPVEAPVIGNNLLIPTRPEKKWFPGHPLDLDSLATGTLNRYDWIITPRDAAGSTPPEELRPVKFTQSFVLWRRTATIQSRRVLDEGPNAAAVLDCSTPRGSAIQRAGGVAAVRQPTVSAAVPPIQPGTVQEVQLSLGAGTWELQAPYASKLDIEVTAPGLRATLPANLDRPGTRWRIGRIRLAAPATVTVQIRVAKPRLGPAAAVVLDALLATPAISPRVVDVRAACGQLVDWYRLGASGGQPVSPAAGG